MMSEMEESEEIFFTRLTRKKEIQDCPIAKKREKAFKKRKVMRPKVNLKDKLNLVILF